MQIYISPQLNTRFFQERAIEVLYKMKGEECIDFDLIVIEHSKQCGRLFKEVPISNKAKFLSICKGMRVSTSFRIGSQEFIIIKVDMPFLKKNESACRGLIAHEMMHTVIRKKGEEDIIEHAGFDFLKKFIKGMLDAGLSKDRAMEFSIEVMKNAIFSLKDLFCNTELIRQSFYTDLEQYYTNLFETKAFYEIPKYYKKEKSLEDVQDAICFELQLLPSWIPFIALESGRRSKIREVIEDRLEVNIRKTAYCLRNLMQVYVKHYYKSKKVKFVKLYYEELLNSVSTLIEKRLR